MFNGDRVKDLITQRGMTQTQFAKRLGMSLSTFTHMIAADANPTSRNAELIAENLGVPLQDLFYSTNNYEVVENKELKAQESIPYKLNASDAETIRLMQKIIDAKDALIAEKENLVKEKERTIRILLKEKGL